MTTLLRDSPTLQESDGAIHWQKHLDHPKGFVKTLKWSVEDWKMPGTRIGQDRVRVLHQQLW